MRDRHIRHRLHSPMGASTPHRQSAVSTLAWVPKLCGVKCAYLRGEVETEVAVACEGVLDQKGHLVRQTELDCARQCRRLAKVHKVLEREGQRNGLTELDLNSLVRFLDVRVLAQRDRAVADVALGRELDAILGRLDSDCAERLLVYRRNFA